MLCKRKSFKPNISLDLFPLRAVLFVWAAPAQITRRASPQKPLEQARIDLGKLFKHWSKLMLFLQFDKEKKYHLYANSLTLEEINDNDNEEESLTSPSVDSTKKHISDETIKLIHDRN